VKPLVHLFAATCERSETNTSSGACATENLFELIGGGADNEMIARRPRVAGCTAFFIAWATIQYGPQESEKGRIQTLTEIFFFFFFLSFFFFFYGFFFFVFLAAEAPGFFLILRLFFMETRSRSED